MPTPKDMPGATTVVEEPATPPEATPIVVEQDAEDDPYQLDSEVTDATAEVALRFPVWLLRHAVNCGQGTALRTGLEFALARGLFDAHFGDSSLMISDLDVRVYDGPAE